MHPLPRQQQQVLVDDETTYPSPVPSPRPGLRLSLHLSHNKVDVTSHPPPSHLPYTSTTPRHSASSSISSSSSSSSSTATAAAAAAPLIPAAPSYFSDGGPGAMVAPHFSDGYSHILGDKRHSPPTTSARLSFTHSGQKSPRQASATALSCLHCTSPLSPSRKQPPSSSFTQQRIPLASTPTPSDTIGQPPAAFALEPSIHTITNTFQTLDPTAQLALLTALINNCSTSQLTLLNNIIAPKLKRDFLHDLPLELAHHILSFVDDPQSLTRVSQVSRFWHQLVESEDWVWRAQCVKLFGPTSCSSLPSPKSHTAPPTSYLYTTSPTSLDAVSSTLKALSHNNSTSTSSSSSNQTSGSSGSNSPVSLSHRLSLVSGSPSSFSTSGQASSWMNARDLPLTASHSNSGSSSSASTTSTTTATEDTEEVLSSMLLDSRHKRHSLPAFSSHSGLALSVLSSVESKATTTPVSAAAAAAALSAARKRKFKRSSLLDLKDVSAQSLNSTLALARQGRTLAQQVQDPDQSKPLSSSSSSSSTSSRIRPYLQHHGRPTATLSYKAYFKRRFMIDRNWVSGRHTLISYTTPETGVVTSLQFDHHHIVVGCDNSRIQIFETTTGRLLRTLQGHHGGVWALEFLKGTSTTGEKILVSGGCDR
ncbi:hypothetical protein BGZ75_008477 [Mortierella antarctica]|nr:hypothetical protein BGZ75_008477 [Mortierella antarctica]